MYGDYEAELRGDVPKRQAMTRGDLLLALASIVAAWLAFIGVCGVLYHGVRWLMGGA